MPESDEQSKPHQEQDVRDSEPQEEKIESVRDVTGEKAGTSVENFFAGSEYPVQGLGYVKIEGDNATINIYMGEQVAPQQESSLPTEQPIEGSTPEKDDQGITGADKIFRAMVDTQLELEKINIEDWDNLPSSKKGKLKQKAITSAVNQVMLKKNKHLADSLKEHPDVREKYQKKYGAEVEQPPAPPPTETTSGEDINISEEAPPSEEDVEELYPQQEVGDIITPTQTESSEEEGTQEEDQSVVQDTESQGDEEIEAPGEEASPEVKDKQARMGSQHRRLKERLRQLREQRDQLSQEQQEAVQGEDDGNPPPTEQAGDETEQDITPLAPQDTDEEEMPEKSTEEDKTTPASINGDHVDSDGDDVPPEGPTGEETPPPAPTVPEEEEREDEEKETGETPEPEEKPQQEKDQDNLVKWNEIHTLFNEGKLDEANRMWIENQESFGFKDFAEFRETIEAAKKAGIAQEEAFKYRHSLPEEIDPTSDDAMIIYSDMQKFIEQDEDMTGFGFDGPEEAELYKSMLKPYGITFETKADDVGKIVVTSFHRTETPTSPDKKETGNEGSEDEPEEEAPEDDELSPAPIRTATETEKEESVDKETKESTKKTHQQIDQEHFELMQEIESLAAAGKHEEAERMWEENKEAFGFKDKDEYDRTLDAAKNAKVDPKAAFQFRKSLPEDIDPTSPEAHQIYTEMKAIVMEGQHLKRLDSPEEAELYKNMLKPYGITFETEEDPSGKIKVTSFNRPDPILTEELDKEDESKVKEQMDKVRDAINKDPMDRTKEEEDLIGEHFTYLSENEELNLPEDIKEKAERYKELPPQEQLELLNQIESMINVGQSEEEVSPLLNELKEIGKRMDKAVLERDMDEMKNTYEELKELMKRHPDALEFKRGARDAGKAALFTALLLTGLFITAELYVIKGMGGIKGGK